MMNGITKQQQNNDNDDDDNNKLLADKDDDCDDNDDDYCNNNNVDDYCNNNNQQQQQQQQDLVIMKESDNDDDEDYEDVLIVPQRLTKLAYDICCEYGVNAKPYHLEGRYGSRTHRVSSTTMGLPIISRELILEKANITNPKLNDILKEDDDVSIIRKRFWPAPSFRAKNPPEIDATIHPELKPKNEPAAVDYTKKPPPIIQQQPSSSKSLFTYGELFAGIGGFGIALDALGGKCIFVSELEQHLRDIYEYNLLLDSSSKSKSKSSSKSSTTKNNNNNNNNIMFGNIYDVKDDDLPSEGKLDILVGGFPCQPFSTLGEQPGIDDKSGKGLLFLQIVRVLQISKPKSFLLENVPGLLGMKGTYDLIIQKFTDCGYKVKTEIISSRGMTVTGRKRLYFVGHRINNDLIKDDDNNNNYQFPFIPDLKLRAIDILDYDELPYNELDILRLSEKTMNQLLESKRFRPASLAWPNKSLETLISHYGNAVGRGESQLVPSKAPYNPRRFSIRECARIMGFPNTYKFLKQRHNDNQGDMAYRKEYYRAFGNAVCPPIIAVLVGSVLDYCQIPPLSGGIDNDNDNEKEEATTIIDWTTKGRQIGIQLAWDSTRPNGQVKLPRGCLPITSNDDTKETKRSMKRKKQHQQQQQQQKQTAATS